MIRKFLTAVSLAGLLFLGLSAHARPTTTQTQSPSGKQSQQSTQSVNGKVASIAEGGHAFTLEVSDGKQSMDFVVDQNTRVKGQVKEGTPVTVEYQAMENGQNVAVTVTAQA